MKASAVSSRERYLTAFRHEEPDRVPVFLDFGVPCNCTAHIKWLNQFERAEVLLAHGCDPMINLWLPDPVPHPDVDIKVKREKKGDGRIYLEKAFYTPKGVLRQVVEETEDWCDAQHGLWVQRTLGTGLREEYGIHVFDDWNISRRTEPWVKGPEDLEKLPYILQAPPAWRLDEWRHDAQRAIEFAQKHGLLTMVRRTIVSDASQWFCDIPWFMMQLYDNPDFVESFLAIFEDVATWQAQLALELKPDVFQHRGWYDGPEFWGGKHFDTHILPIINRQAEMVHQAGALHCYLLTEGWGPYLETFNSLKSDILWGADPVLGKTDLRTIKQKVGEEKTILGGISSEHHLTGCSLEVTRRATREAIDALAPGGGFVLASNSSIWPQVGWDHLAAMIEEAHGKGRYPIS